MQGLKTIFNRLSEQIKNTITENIVLEKAPEIENSMASTLNNSPMDLMLKSLSLNEQNRLKAGEQVKLYMEVEDATKTVHKSKKDLLEKTMQDISDVLNEGKVDGTKREPQLGMYFELNLMKQVGDDEVKRIARPQGMLDVSIQIPEHLQNKNKKVQRVYQVIRIYNGKSVLLDVEFNAKTNTLSFQTNKFATFTLIYTDIPLEK